MRSRLMSIVVLSAVSPIAAACSTQGVGAGGSTPEQSASAVLAVPDKLDVLVMVDNSSSMADKQAILAKSLPGLLARFATPTCLDENGIPNGQRADVATGACASGRAEMRAIDDIHVGVISSSLGSRGANTCKDLVQRPHSDDGAHLLNRGNDPAAAAGFLSWKRGASNDLNAFSASAGKLVASVGQDGCGLEAQLESVYRFLVQPDPYAKVTLNGNEDACQGVDMKGGSLCEASLEGVDDVLLKQRAAFLRPDSLVAVVVLTDEDDASVDPLAMQGTGWTMLNTYFPGSPILRTIGGLTTATGGTTAPLPTTACAVDPSSPDCKSCAFRDDVGSTTIADDANCQRAPHYYGGDDDHLNSRFFNMKARYGFDPRFPISRYVDGLTKIKVPSRATERDATGTYVGTANCTNPLFAAQLPVDSSAGVESLCNLAVGTRTPDQIYFTVIGGAPPELVASPTPTEGDWTRILGADPAKFDLSGIDPHMIQSISPRAGLEGPASVGANGSDPVHGREWESNKTDLQFACTFELPAPSSACAEGDVSCDCDGVKSAPLCDSANPRVQVRGKAYPTSREFQVARALGAQGTIGSLCSVGVGGVGGDEVGYGPQLSVLASRVKASRSE